MASRKATPAEIKGRNSTRYLKLKARYRSKCQAHNVPCHLCGQPIDYSLPSGEDPSSFEVGPFKDCNASRGTADVAPTLGNPSEAW